MHSSWRTVARLGVTLAVGMLGLTACGLPRPEATMHAPANAAASPAASSTSSSLPPRPFEIPLDDIDPCRILDARQRAELGFDRGPLPDREGGFTHTSTCGFRNTQAKVAARLALITSSGMAVWSNDTMRLTATPTVLAGFPALVVRTPLLNLVCDVEVDVADGQHLDVLYRDDNAQPPASLDQLCAGARRVARTSIAALARTHHTAPSG